MRAPVTAEIVKAYANLPKEVPAALLERHLDAARRDLAGVTGPEAAPLDAAVRYPSSGPPGAVAINYGVESLRTELPDQCIYDAYYAAHAAEDLRLAGDGWRLTGTEPPTDKHPASLPGRFPGERSLWLYRGP